MECTAPCDQNWALLSVEQKASADGIRRELRKTLSVLVPEIQDAPLLDKLDLERFKLGRTMDAALRFEPFRGNRIGHLTSDVFREACEEARELLELLPRKGPWQPPVAVRCPFSKSRRQTRRPTGRRNTQGVIGEIVVAEKPKLKPPQLLASIANCLTFLDKVQLVK